MSARRTGGSIGWALVLACATASAHDGPPFPIVSSESAGPYVVSVWTDPDTTDDGSPGGQFWVRLHAGGERQPVPTGTHALVTIRPLDRPGPERTAKASPVRDDVSNQFAGVVMDHEGRFAVHVLIDGPLGRASVSGSVDATYDLRPAPVLMVLYLVPFVLVGALWLRLLLRRRRVLSPDETPQQP